MINKKNQKGFTLVELILVVGLMMLITLTIIAGYRSVSFTNSINKEVDYYIDINKAANNLYTNSRNFSGSPYVITMSLNNLTTSGMLKSYDGMFNTPPAVNVASHTGGGTSNLLLTITRTGINNKECVAISKILAPLSYDILVNGNLLPKASRVANNISPYADITRLTTLCNNASNNIIIRFLKEINTKYLNNYTTTNTTSLTNLRTMSYYTEYKQAIAVRDTEQIAIP